MFHNISDAVLKRMRELEQKNTNDKRAGVPPFERLRQIPPITGRFLALTAAAAPDGDYIEVGTSGGYSALWLSLACRALGRTLTTFELAEPKLELAAETFRVAGIDDIVTIVPGDARDNLAEHGNVSFCFLDTEKTLYEDCYELVVPNMVEGGVLIADNMVSHAGDLAGFLDRAESDLRVDSMVVPIGEGLLIARKS